MDGTRLTGDATGASPWPIVGVVVAIVLLLWLATYVIRRQRS